MTVEERLALDVARLLVQVHQKAVVIEEQDEKLQRQQAAIEELMGKVQQFESALHEAMRHRDQRIAHLEAQLFPKGETHE